RCWSATSRRPLRSSAPTCRCSSSNRSPSPAPRCRTIRTTRTTWRPAGTTYGWRADGEEWRKLPPTRRAETPEAAADPGRAADPRGRDHQLLPDPDGAGQLPRADDRREPGQRSRHHRPAAQDLRAGGPGVAAAAEVHLGATALRLRLLL